MAKALFAPCPPSMKSSFLSGGHAEPVIGRAFARPGGFAQAMVLS